MSVEITETAGGHWQVIKDNEKLEGATAFRRAEEAIAWATANGLVISAIVVWDQPFALQKVSHL